MGEHDENSIQSNIESYNNLDKFLNEMERKRSFCKSQRSFTDAQPKKKIQTLYTSPKMEIIKNKNHNFLKPESRTSFFMDKEKKKIFTNEEKFENAVKAEVQSRKNPLKVLELYIKRIKRLCTKLKEVNLIIYLYLYKHCNLIMIEKFK